MQIETAFTFEGVQYAGEIEVKDDHLFVDTNEQGIKVIRYSESGGFNHYATIERDSEQLVMHDGGLFIIADGMLTVYDVSDVDNLHYAGELDFSEDLPNCCTFKAVAAEDNYLYFTYTQSGSSEQGLAIFDVSDYANMTYISSYTFSKASTTNIPFVISGDTAYVSAENENLHIVDISDKANPSFVSSFESINPTKLMKFSDKLISYGASYIEKYTIASPHSPGLMNTFPIEVNGDKYRYADMDNGVLRLFSLEDGIETFNEEFLGDLTQAQYRAYAKARPTHSITNTQFFGSAEGRGRVASYGINQAPRWIENSVRLAPGESKSGTLTAIDDNGDEVYFQVKEMSEFAVIELQPSGEFTITADTGLEGADSFSIELSDRKGGLTSIQLPVRVQATPTPTPTPTATPVATTQPSGGSSGGGGGGTMNFNLLLLLFGLSLCRIKRLS